eukprot:gb/GECG01012652.1/.p1 GENE.gb/GECG01012652.1/~~gb/GECG01012652.1/.p1  ORF type:complete len:498 (+),score=39.37 gb/GECG01012652.1/:1-1494(+)
MVVRECRDCYTDKTLSTSTIVYRIHSVPTLLCRRNLTNMRRHRDDSTLKSASLAAVCLAFLGCVLQVPPADAISIDEFGAKAGEFTPEAAETNSEALRKALYWANDSSTDRTVQVPESKGYLVFNATVRCLYNVTLEVDGNLTMAPNISWWPYKSQRPYYFSLLAVLDSSLIEIRGTGLLDGQGYNWWWAKFLVEHVSRPFMITMDHCTDVEIHGITAIDSPKWHFKLYHMRRLHIHDITIRVDIFKQKETMIEHGYWMEQENELGGLPIFPLNTDGIDPRGVDVLIENVRIENFDDAVAVKPLTSEDPTFNCTRNVTVRNSFVRYGVGMTIGSVPPHPSTSCVRDVFFENITFESPIKAIYIKTNPGDKGDGIIDNIHYTNISASNSFWYPIWIGPQQQQQQPGKTGTGCSFLYPIIPECPTQPRVTVSNVFIEDATFTHGWTLPGVLLCNETNPCQNFDFKRVINAGKFVVQKDYICKNVASSNCSECSPQPGCF